MEITGIVNIQCSHVFIKSTVDLQLGEKHVVLFQLIIPSLTLCNRHGSIDYALDHAILNTKPHPISELYLSFVKKCDHVFHTTTLAPFPSKLSSALSSAFQAKLNLSETYDGWSHCYMFKITKTTASTFIHQLMFMGWVIFMVKLLRCHGLNLTSLHHKHAKWIMVIAKTR